MRAPLSNLNETTPDDVASDQLAHERQPLVIDVDQVLASHPIRDDRIAARFNALISRGFDLLTRRGGSHQPPVDPTQVLLNEDVLSLLLRAVGQGRAVYLCSETRRGAYVTSVAEHLGVSTAWSAEDVLSMDDAVHLPAGLQQGFEYIGTRTDFPLTVSKGARSASDDPKSGSGLRNLAKLLRVHQYAKNALVLVPLLTAHKFDLVSLATALLAVGAFSLAASSTYILNDLFDVEADRAHSTKRHRPIASGAISPRFAMSAMAIAMAGAVTLASLISWQFFGVLIGYIALTSAYSGWLKRVAIVDVVTLAILYTIRVLGGAVAIGVSVSEWLFAFSLFIFTSLALIKRHVELIGQSQEKVLAARGYQPSDAPMIAILAAGAGFSAVVIFTLYISSETVSALYSHPQLLWMNCPILLYWIARVMLLAQRGLIHDDPIIFALKDRASWLVLAMVGVLTLAAI